MYIHRLHELRVVNDKLRLCREITRERVGRGGCVSARPSCDLRLGL